VKYKAPCWVSHTNGPSGFPELLIGNAYGLILPNLLGTDRHAYAYFHNVGMGGLCPGGPDAGTVTWSSGAQLFLRLASWYAIDQSNHNGGTVTIVVTGQRWIATTIGLCMTSGTLVGALPTLTFAPLAFTDPEFDWEDSGRFGSARGWPVPIPMVGVTDAVRFTITVTVTATMTGSLPPLAVPGCVQYTGS
jgi:hypothetical protein